MHIPRNISVRVNIFYKEVWEWFEWSIIAEIPSRENDISSENDFTRLLPAKNAIQNWQNDDNQIAWSAWRDLDTAFTAIYPPDEPLHHEYGRSDAASWSDLSSILDDRNNPTLHLDHSIPAGIDTNDGSHRQDITPTIQASNLTSDWLNDAFELSRTWDIKMDFPTEWWWGTDAVSLHREPDGSISLLFWDGTIYRIYSRGNDQIWEIQFLQTLSGTPMLRRLLQMGTANFDQFCRDIGCIHPYTTRESQNRFMNIALRTLGILSRADIRSMPIDFSLGRPVDIGISTYMTAMRRWEWREWLKINRIMRADNSLDPMKLRESIRQLQSGWWENISA